MNRPQIVSALFILPLCLLVLFFFLADLFLDAQLRRDWHWAGIQLWQFPVPYRVIAALSPLIALLLPARIFQEILGIVSRFWQRMCQSVAAAPVYTLALAVPLVWVFRSTTLIFGDSYFFASDVFPREAMSERGVLLTYDSIGVTVVYSYGHRLLSLFTSADVVTTFNLIGVVSLLAFFAWAWRARHTFLGTPLLLLVLFLGNWSQATMAPVENYVQKFLLLVVFCILAVEAIAGRQSMWKACLAYSLACFFHLGAGWMFPALAFMLWKCWKRESMDNRLLALSAMVIPAMLTGSFAYYWGFDISFFTASNAGMGKLIPLLDESHPYSGRYYHYSTFDPRHLYHILSQAILTGFPGLLLLLGGVVHYRWRAFSGNGEGIFLLVFFASALLFNLVWNPDLEFWADQDLFSSIGLAICLLGVWAWAGPAGVDVDEDLRARLLAAAIVGGIAWRVPVILFHSVLSVNYLDPSLVRSIHPF